MVASILDSLLINDKVFKKISDHPDYDLDITDIRDLSLNFQNIAITSQDLLSLAIMINQFDGEKSNYTNNISPIADSIYWYLFKLIPESNGDMTEGYIVQDDSLTLRLNRFAEYNTKWLEVFKEYIENPYDGLVDKYREDAVNKAYWKRIINEINEPVPYDFLIR